jgi:phosphatidylserine/phosphatidylglycerophosphate/cardiolipin synthase-like enzyme
MSHLSMSLRLVFLAVLAVVLASCGGNLPNSAISRHLAGRYAGALTDSTAVATVIRDRGIRVPDVASPVPLLEQLQAELTKSDPAGAYAGITYDLTRGNTLPRDWIVQTPNSWGLKASALQPGHSEHLVQLVHDLIASARQRVDISLLQPAPDGQFLAAIRQALQELAQRRRPIEVRVIIGQYPPDNVDVPAFFKALTDGLDLGRLTVSVAAFRSCVAMDDCDSYSWNHSKIIAIDGAEALVGGHNLWARDYLMDEPVSDLSMHVKGPAAASAVRFLDRLWEYVCTNLNAKDSIALASSTGSCPAPAALALRRLGRAGLPILGVGRLGAGITKDFANQSELARDLTLATAQHEIRIVQQDLGFRLGRADTLFPDSTIDRLVDFLRQGRGDIYIVLSNTGAKGKSGSTYSNDVTLTMLAKHLKQEVQRRFEIRDPLLRYEIRRGPDPVNALLCDHVHLAPFRFGPDDSWPGGAPFATHAKFWMVDGHVFYVGSDNMYPVNLQEYGYIVDDAKAAQELTDAYWTPVWQWSSRAAVSGPEVKDCIFREVIK